MIDWTDLFKNNHQLINILNPPGSKASSEVANLTERKNTHNLVNCVKYLSVCLCLMNFDLNYLTTIQTEWTKSIFGQCECFRSALYCLNLFKYL